MEQHAQSHVPARSQVCIRSYGSGGGGGVVALQRSGGREFAFVTSAIAMYCPMQWNLSVDCTSLYCITFVPAIDIAPAADSVV